MQPSDENPTPRLNLQTARAHYEESRRLFDTACAVAGRRDREGLAAAPLLKRSLHSLLGLVVRIDSGEPVPAAFDEVVRRAQAIAADNKLCPYEFASRVTFIAEMSDRFFRVDADITDDELERYEYDVDWLPDLYRDVWRYAVRALTTGTERARSRRRATWVAAVGGVIVVGAAGLLLRHRAAPGGLAASYYRGANFDTLAYRTHDDRVQFDWGRGSPRGLPADFFSVRWDGQFDVPVAGRYVFGLESDDGSRLFIDGAQLIDNWGMHARTAVEGEITLAPGTHRIRVEYFDQELDAFVELTWSPPSSPRRVMAGGDFR
ncbi:MAG: PA14 domain-containing protein [Deltaproteobacteria bacterium]